jgi:hypothetical protein
VGGPLSWRVRGRGRVCVIDAEGHRCRHSSGAELNLPPVSAAARRPTPARRDPPARP